MNLTVLAACDIIRFIEKKLGGRLGFGREELNE